MQKERGSILPSLIVFMMVIAIISGAVGEAILVNVRSVTNATATNNALGIAESGINYYLWHLNHNSSDYTDGNGTMTAGTLGYGPFTHDYVDINGRKVGAYTLYIKQAMAGSSVATVRSIGKSTASSTIVRTIEAQIGAPSFSTYAVAGNTALWFGDTETASGPVMSNVGVKMDGASNDTVSSAQTTYTVPSWSGTGSGSVKPGVWCNPAITTPVNCNTRNKSSWTYPVPAVDFNALSANMCDLKKLATSLTVCNTVPAVRTPGYVPPVNKTTYSLTVGYLITLNDDGTYNLEKVTAENDTLASYATALTRTSVQTSIAIPSNGIIFVEDNVWLRTAGPNGFPGRVTIVSARLAATGTTTMVFADDVLLKDKYTGSSSIGGIAQDDIEVAPYVGAPAEIDGAYIAKAGSIGIRIKYRKTPTSYVPGYVNIAQAFTFYGSLASNDQWTWSVMRCGTATSTSCWAGYRYTNTIYDARLRYAPPPSFPITSTYDILSWREVLTSP